MSYASDWERGIEWRDPAPITGPCRACGHYRDTPTHEYACPLRDHELHYFDSPTVQNGAPAMNQPIIFEATDVDGDAVTVYDSRDSLARWPDVTTLTVVVKPQSDESAAAYLSTADASRLRAALSRVLDSADPDGLLPDVSDDFVNPRASDRLQVTPSAYDARHQAAQDARALLSDAPGMWGAAKAPTADEITELADWLLSA